MVKRKGAALLLAVLTIWLAAAPLAHADDPGACVDAGNTVEFCDENYLNAIRATGAVVYVPENAIAMGRDFAAIFSRHPNKSQFSLLVNRLLEANAQKGDPLTVDQAVRIVQMAIRYYGPPGLEDTLDSVMGAE